jgi:ABC-type Fe3+ transport system substrate-binding protein
VSLLENQSAATFGQSVVDSSACESVVSTPLVLVAWKERADVLWGDDPGDNLWLNLQMALVNPAGWEDYDQPGWGYIKFGHTDPTKSNSGLMTLLLMTYGYFEQTGDLTPAQVRDDPDFRAWLTALEDTVSTFGNSTGTYMRDIVTYGPSKYDIVAVYESTAIEQAENAAGRYGELRVYYPPATVLSDHPFCALSADWVTPEKAEAAQVFADYLLSRPMQQQALELGFRPADAAVQIDQPGSPFIRLAANGIKTTLPPQVDIPPGNVLNILLGMWCAAVGPDNCPPGSF